MRQEPIARGIPLARVDAVQDADDVGLAPRDDAVEAEAELGRLDFLRVARADGRDEVGVVDAALQKTDASPELHALGAELLPREIEPRQPVGGKEPLIREVVDREDRRGFGEERMRPGGGWKENRR